MGMITCLNDILVPHLKGVFSLTYAQAALVQCCFFTAYLVVSIPSGRFAEKFGYKNGIVVGLLVAAFGCALFWPAAEYLSYSFFLMALFVLASGIVLIQVALNPYVSLLGPPDTASSRLTVTQAFNSVGTAIAPKIGAFFILGSAASAGGVAIIGSQEHASYVQGPYLVLSSIMVVVALVLMAIRMPSVSGLRSSASLGVVHRTMWSHRHLVLGALAIFMYVGAEVSIGSFLINLISLPEVAGIPEDQSAEYLALYWGGAMVGRFVGSAVMRFVCPASVLAFNALSVILLVATAIFSGGYVAVWCLVAVGLFNSVMFPTIFTLAVKGLDSQTSRGSGLLCTSIFGGAIVPVIHGVCADYIGLLPAFSVPLLCYVYVMYYGFRGHRTSGHQGRLYEADTLDERNAVGRVSA